MGKIFTIACLAGSAYGTMVLVKEVANRTKHSVTEYAQNIRSYEADSDNTPVYKPNGCTSYVKFQNPGVASGTVLASTNGQRYTPSNDNGCSAN
jgi:hypothetical protein